MRPACARGLPAPGSIRRTRRVITRLLAQSTQRFLAQVEEELQMSATALRPIPEKLFMGRDAAAEAIDVSTRTIDDAIRDGELEAFRVGRRVLISRNALIRFARR